jgi:FlaA1/EpsC-like NDP-sugar epimerase
VAGEVEQMAVYWSEFSDCVRSFERSTEGEAAVYGSGFYGTYIHVCVEDSEQVVCFLDQNPHRQGQELLGKPIIAPDALPESVRRLYVGLNPAVAREALDGLDWGRELEVFYP